MGCCAGHYCVRQVLSSLFSLYHEGALESDRQQISRIGDRLEYFVETVSYDLCLVAEECAHTESHRYEGVYGEVVCDFQILYRSSLVWINIDIGRQHIICLL